MRICTYYRTLVFFLSLFAISCQAPLPAGENSADTASAERQIGRRGGELNVRMTTAPNTFNYLLAKDEPSIAVSFFLMTARLIEFDQRTQKYVPALAEKFKPDADGQTVRVKLREGLKFSDGSPLTAEDVVFSLSALYDANTNSPVYRDAMLIEGKPITIQKTDDLNFVLSFPQRVASVENYIDNLGILSSKVLGPALSAGKLAGSWKINEDLNGIVVSGPFIPAASTPGEKIVLKRNPNYWKKDAEGGQLPYLDAVNIEVVADPNNTFTRLSQGTLDIADRIRPGDIAPLSEASSSSAGIDVGPGLSTDHMWFNLNPVDAAGTSLAGSAKHRWFTNKDFRRAVSAAIDRENIAKITLQGFATPLSGFVSPANKNWIASELPKPLYDQAAAKEILQKAGFSLTESGGSPVLVDADGNAVEFTLLVPAENEPRKLMAAVVQEDLSRIGIKMRISPVEFKTIDEKFRRSFDYDAILLGLGVTGTEPTTYANFLRSGGAYHQWHPEQKAAATEWEAKIDELFAAQAIEPDRTKRAEIFNRIQMIMADEMPIIPIVARHIIIGANKRVGNLYPAVMLPYSLWNTDELFIRSQ